MLDYTGMFAFYQSTNLLTKPHLFIEFYDYSGKGFKHYFIIRGKIKKTIQFSSFEQNLHS